MANKLLPHSLLAVATLSGFNYTTHYQHPTNPKLPYITFIHGFPSSAYDWRHQVEYFQDQGYGVIAPDTLGYGLTDRPLDVTNYRVRSIADSIMEVVDAIAGKEAKVHGVGHDWGTVMLSRAANFHPDRFLSYSFLATGYSTPTPNGFDVDGLIAYTKQLLGYSTIGYFKFFNMSDAGPIIDSHQHSFADLIYPKNDSLWKEWLGPVGAARTWVTTNKRGPHAKYITDQEFATHNQIFKKSGYSAGLNYYKATMQGLNNADNADVFNPALATNTTDKPALFIGGTKDPIASLPSYVQATRVFAPNTQVANVSAAHWVQLEKPREVNRILARFFKGKDPKPGNEGMKVKVLGGCGEDG